MAWRRLFSPVISIMFLAALCVSCGSSSSSGGADTEIPTEDIPLYGTWAGYFKAGVEDRIKVPSTSNVEDLYLNDIFGNDLFEHDANDLFVIAVIDQGDVISDFARKAQARFISDRSQFVCARYYDDPDDPNDNNDTDYHLLYILNNYNVSKSLLAYSAYYYWDNTTGLGYKASVGSYGMRGATQFTNALISGVYHEKVSPVTEAWKFHLFNYTTSGLSLNISKVVGTWKIQNSFQHGNTLTLTITPDPANPARGTITGGDSGANMENTFTGSIRILYSDSPVYSLSLAMTDAGHNEINLEGLATYIETMNTGGEDQDDTIHVDKTLAIGATGGGTGDRRLITGFATKAQAE